VVTASSFGVLTITPFLSAPWLGPIAIPAALITSAILFYPIIAIRVHRLFGLYTLKLADLALMACGAVLLGLSAISDSRLSAIGTCAVLGLIGVYMLGTALRQSGSPLRAESAAR
jgi:hypothetical protein